MEIDYDFLLNRFGKILKISSIRLTVQRYVITNIGMEPKNCIWHRCEKKAFIQNKFCSPSCKNKYYVTQRREKLKSQTYEWLGGCCEKCHYNNVAGLTIVNKSGKVLDLISKGHTPAWRSIQKSLEGCKLICVRCVTEFK